MATQAEFSLLKLAAHDLVDAVDAFIVALGETPVNTAAAIRLVDATEKVRRIYDNS